MELENDLHGIWRKHIRTKTNLGTMPCTVMATRIY